MNGTMRAKTIDRAALRLAVAMGASCRWRCVRRARAGGEELERPHGRRMPGRIARASGFRFAPRDGGADRDGAGDDDPPGGADPRRGRAGNGRVLRRSSCRPAGPRGSRGDRRADEDRGALGPGWQAGELTLPRRCVQAIVQRPGGAGAGRWLRDDRRGAMVGHGQPGDRRTAAAGRGSGPPAAGRGGLADPQPGGAAGRRPARAGLPR